jgi:hypothetical protein
MSNSDPLKQFILCLGTQKAGTSWLFDLLSKAQGACMGFVKELHVFDHLEFDEFLNVDRTSLQRICQAKAKPNADMVSLWRRLLMMSDPKEYFNYFHKLLSAPGVVITGDFTPEYCLLPEEKLQHIKSCFEEREIKVKVIFLMRDPVERIWSATRMTKREHKTNLTLLESYKSKYVEMLTRYEALVPKIANVFNDEDLYIDFYECLFEQSTIDRITDFLSLPRQNPDFDKFINASRYEKIQLTQRITVENYYSRTYDYIMKTFPGCPIRRSTQS